jgi:ectoine hydroxylase-related dioxygenase (phytanoyl-CoA dioxygenase family)
MKLSTEQVDSYKKNGYLGVEGVFSASELDDLKRVTEEFVDQSRDHTEHTDVFDLDFGAGHSKETPKLRRIKNPHAHHAVYDAALRKPELLDILEGVLGPNIRMHHTKLNMKAPGGGQQVEWHTDWGFYPHTNDDIVEVGLAFDDMEIENGCLMVIPGSQLGPAYDHHEDGVFVGAVAEDDFSLEEAEPIMLKAGGISLHHVRALHGSAPNVSDRPRRLLLMGYSAADAFPLTGYGDWDKWESMMLRGEPTNQPRLEKVPVRIAEPKPEQGGSIFEIQDQLKKSHYADFEKSD